MNLFTFRATHTVSKDFDYWDQHVPVKDGNGMPVAVHVYYHRGSPFVLVERMSLVPRRTWFEFEWHQGCDGKRDTLEAAESALFHGYVSVEDAA